MILALLNEKGGVGKTTTAVHLAGALADQGKRVLVIDADLQKALTMYFEVDTRSRPTLADALLDDVPLKEIIVPVRERIWIVPASARMELADRELPSLPGADLRLRAALREAGAIINGFDFVLIDCPSGWGATIRNALAASNGYILLINSETPALDAGLATARKAAGLAKFYDDSARLFGVLLTMTRTTNNAASVARQCADNWPCELFKSQIKRAERINEMATLREIAFEAPSARARGPREDYEQLASEVIQRCRKSKKAKALTR